MTPLNPDFRNLAEMPRRAVKALLEDLDAIVLPVDLEGLCQLNDWPLFFLPLDNEKQAATTIIDGESIQIVVNTKYCDNQNGFSEEPSLRRRQRFSLAHEIAHACLNSHKDFALQKQLVTENPHGTRYHLMREAQANEFASELLMPQSILEPRMRSFNWDDVIEQAGLIAEEFDVSLTAALRRVTGFANFPALMFYFMSDRRAPQGAIASRYFSDTGLQRPTGNSMPHNSLVARLANDGQCRVRTIRKMNASVWFQGRDIQRFTLQEWAKRLGDMGFLTFISIVEDENWSDSRERSGGRYQDDDDDWGYS